ncbi:MAG: hypothetical protein QM723_01865 [Myxococcaceae bacterium]
MRRILFAAAVLAALSCGSSAMMMMDVPVKDQPLAGTIGGQPWTAVSAIAKPSDPFNDDGGEKFVNIYDKQYDCTSFSTPDDRSVLAIVPWVVGAYNFSTQHNGTIVLDDGGTPDNLIGLDGRIELRSAPQADAGINADMSIRIDVNQNNVVEGKIQVHVCDGF